MSSAMKWALISSKGNCLQMRTALFHSTPIMERRRRNNWDSRCNPYSKRFRRIHEKEQLLRNVGAYTDFFFQSWKDEADEDDPPSSRGASWFKRQYSAKGSRRDRSSNQGSQHWARRGFEFCEEDVDVENIFRSTFGGSRFFYWSFINDEDPQWRSSTRYSNYYGKSWNWRHWSEEESDSSTESDSLDLALASDRQALGLSASGPLKLKDVKNAYRACALKWHPDRHHGSSKALAEEKFKVCSAAYQSLCDKLEVS
ncbi:DnaJ domain containing protein [Quillaja saponaria]|uniref:DnaJ domain containing protein n=1 Tax=Quillaja saponaria TaxID=32244 RepID=A0AAD7VHT4_QUISA|nr:DnaJ domain containing protein [Quillaja saponaria]